MKIIILNIIFIIFLSSCNIIENNQDTLSIVESNIWNHVSIWTYDFNELINNKTETDVILDVRTLEEYNQWYIKWAILLDYYKPHFKEHLNLLNKEKTYYIYCRSGNRSW
jgi:hypothetical protein